MRTQKLILIPESVVLAVAGVGTEIGESGDSKVGTTTKTLGAAVPDVAVPVIQRPEIAVETTRDVMEAQRATDMVRQNQRLEKLREAQKAIEPGRAAATAERSESRAAELAKAVPRSGAAQRHARSGELRSPVTGAKRQHEVDRQNVV